MTPWPEQGIQTPSAGMRYLHLPDQAGRLTYWQMAGQLNPAGLSEQGMTPDLVRDDYVPFEKQVCFRLGVLFLVLFEFCLFSVFEGKPKRKPPF